MAGNPSSGTVFTLWQRFLGIEAEDKLVSGVTRREVLVTSDSGGLVSKTVFPIAAVPTGPPSYRWHTLRAADARAPNGQPPGYVARPRTGMRSMSSRTCSPAARGQGADDRTCSRPAFGEGRLTKEEFRLQVRPSARGADLRGPGRPSSPTCPPGQPGPAGAVMPYHGYYPAGGPRFSADQRASPLGAMICGDSRRSSRSGLAAISRGDPRAPLGARAQIRAEPRGAATAMAVAGLVLGLPWRSPAGRLVHPSSVAAQYRQTGRASRPRSGRAHAVSRPRFPYFGAVFCLAGGTGRRTNASCGTLNAGRSSSSASCLPSASRAASAYG